MSDQQALWGERRDTLLEARRMVQHGRVDGITCPCCDQFAKVYRRKLNASMARALLALARRPDLEWVHLFDFLQQESIQHSDAPMLRHWGLIEDRGDERADGNPRAGFYRLTDRGRSYACRPDAILPRHALIYNDHLLGFSEETTTLRQALGSKFDYSELITMPGLP